MRMKTARYRQIILVGMILLEAGLIRMLLTRDKPMTEVDWLTAYTVETDEFRAVDFGENGLEQVHLMGSQWKTDIYSILAAGLVREAVSVNDSDGSTDESTKTAELSYKEYRHLAEILPEVYAEFKDNFRVDLD